MGAKISEPYTLLQNMKMTVWLIWKIKVLLSHVVSQIYKKLFDKYSNGF